MSLLVIPSSWQTECSQIHELGLTKGNSNLLLEEAVNATVFGVNSPHKLVHVEAKRQAVVPMIRSGRPEGLLCS